MRKLVNILTKLLEFKKDNEILETRKIAHLESQLCVNEYYYI